MDIKEKISLHSWAENVISQNNFSDAKLIYEGVYYAPGNIRNLIYAGEFEGKKSVLKIYDDPRLTNEPQSLEAFHTYNKSPFLKAPELFKYHMESPQKGWFIMEHLPKGAKHFTTPLSSVKRIEFLSIYKEYRKNFPTEPTRELLLAEKLPAHEFHTFRISRWFELATKKDIEHKILHGESIFDDEFLSLYVEGLELVRKEFSTRKMVWCHGHFKPQEIFSVDGSATYYLTDFAHTHLFPEGYEFGFMIWADYLMSSDWSLEYSDWKKPVFEWIESLRSVAEDLTIKRYDDLIRASLVERIMGTILGDVGSSDIDLKDKKHRLAYLYKLLGEFV